MATFDPKAPNSNANGSNRDTGSGSGGSGYDDAAFRNAEEQHMNDPADGDQIYRRVYDATYSGAVCSQPDQSGK